VRQLFRWFRRKKARAPLRILLDNGIFSHSEFAEYSIEHTSVRWGNTEHVLPVQGFIRKAPDSNLEERAQKEALFTIGRLIREGRMEAHRYIEIFFEGMRGRTALSIGNALHGCNIRECPPALERSKFRSSVDLWDTISKGGKKDRKAGVKLGATNQIAFLEWLCTLEEEHVEALRPHAAQIGLTAFEIESLTDLKWFKFLCQRSGSRENYPDVFHLWTAERNNLDGMLTLDRKLSNIVTSVRKERERRIEIKTQVLCPLELLRKLGIDKPDPVPLEVGRFYQLHELTG